MGDLQAGLRHDEAAEEEDVDVQGTFPPAALPAPVPAVGGFYPVDFAEEFSGAAAVIPRHRGVEKQGLINYMKGYGFVYGSLPQAAEDLPQGRDGPPEDLPGGPQIGTKAENDELPSPFGGFPLRP
jgi:hypothetical protein